MNLWSVEEGASQCGNGAVVLYPTETLWGVGGDARDSAVAAKVLVAKGIDSPRPFPVLCDSVERALGVVDGELPGFRELAGRFWPGGLTLVVPVLDRRLADVAGLDGRVGLRVSAVESATQLASGAGGFLLSTSANLTGCPPPHAFHEIDSTVKERVDGAVDTLRISQGEPSTVLSFEEGGWRCLRPGSVSRGELVAILGEGGAHGLR